MAGAVLTNQLKSLNDACLQLQQRLGGDAKAAELLYCMRGLVTMLSVESESAPQLVATALQALAPLRPAINHLTGTMPGDANQAGDLIPLLRETHAQLAAFDTAKAVELCRQLVKIEGDYLDGFERAFQAAHAPQAAAQATAGLGINKELLRDFLAQTFSAPGLLVDSVDIISGGFSKQTMKVQVSNGDSGAAQALPETLILRLDLPAETAFSGTLVVDEYPIYEVAFHHGVRVPRPYALESSREVAGRMFIVLGLVLGRTIGTLFNYPPADADAAGLGADIARQLAAIHTVPASALGPEVMGPEKSTMDRVRGEIAIARRNWMAIQRQSAIVEEAFRTLQRMIHLAEGSHCLVHGDFGLHNIMVDAGKVSAILDWEFGKVGNPADDLGYFHDTAEHLMGWDNFLVAYARAGGTVPPQDQIDFYRLLAMVRICVLVSQADAAFVAGILPQIQYAPPGSLFLRGMMVKLARMVERLG